VPAADFVAPLVGCCAFTSGEKAKTSAAAAMIESKNFTYSSFGVSQCQH
jgi:hypothetical protein